MAVILCYGDSNTHGSCPMSFAGDSRRYAPGQPWPDVMARELGPQHRVLAEGLPGRTTVHDDLVEGGARNGLAVLPAILHSHKPIDLLILMLGTNDLKPRFSVTSFEIARSALRLAQFARGEGVVGDVMLVAPAPVLETRALADVFAGAEQRQAGLADHLKSMAHGDGFGFVDAGSIVQVSDVDGVHWEADMHDALGTEMSKRVLRRLGETANT